VGKDNKRRRADKKRRARTTAGGRRTYAYSSKGPFESDPLALAEGLVFAAADAAEANHDGEADDLLQCVQMLGSHSTGGPVATWVLSGCLERAIRGAWAGGWQPADVVRAATKRLDASAVDLALNLIASDSSTSAPIGVSVPPAWASQLRDIRARVWWDASGGTFADQWSARMGAEPSAELRSGIDLLGMLLHLPIFPSLLSPPSEWERAGVGRTARPIAEGVDGRVLAKVRALLAKAESTTFDAEADSLTAKAQELMARYAIDSAMLHAGGAKESPTGRRLGIDDPYASAKAELLAVVSRANRCRAVWHDSYGLSTVFGFGVDLDIVEVLYTSLLVQATRSMTAAGTVRDRYGRSRTRSFRQSFLVSFASRIGERLRGATDAAERAAGHVHGGALLPVLAGRRAAVDEALTAAFPDLVPNGVSVTNYEGWLAGRVAADLASLGPEQALPPGVAI
jgi:hypothetical protein